MLATTIEIIRIALKSDPSLAPTQRARLLALFRNGVNSSKPEVPTDRVERLVRRAEAAKRLGCSLRLVDRLAKEGILPKRKLPGRTRASGILQSDLDALLAAKNPQKEAA